MPHLIKRSQKKLIVCGDVFEIYNYEKPYYYNFPPTARKSYHFEDKKKSPERRTDNLLRARQTLKRIILSNANQYSQKPLFVTYTFASNVSDPTIANPEWSAFSRRFNNYLATLGYAKAKYICIIEFQKRGAVHYHVLYFNVPFIPELKIHLATLWGLGFIKLNAIQNVRYLASYVSKYLQKGISDERIKAKKAYFSSRNLYKPLVFRNEKDIPSILSDLSDKRIIKRSVIEKYISGKYGLVEYNQITHEN